MKREPVLESFTSNLREPSGVEGSIQNVQGLGAEPQNPQKVIMAFYFLD